jgi:DNA ligase-4
MAGRTPLDHVVSCASVKLIPVKIFDILYLNDVCLTHKRLSERKRLLLSNKIFNNIDDYKGRIEYAEEQKGKSGKDIRAMLERILETKCVHTLRN